MDLRLLDPSVWRPMRNGDEVESGYAVCKKTLAERESTRYIRIVCTTCTATTSMNMDAKDSMASSCVDLPIVDEFLAQFSYKERPQYLRFICVFPSP